ncbi:phage baseplate assembly protein V [uncultured Pelagimonas sp.]|uniref:phage baseplate assembly protein V n=1 Tax=uncultured Pelagimonas sp. TaxID=1618102 RepID=UPI0026219FEB|nr:phage baseplate assembly protein V [uncultured Pelagimonas sp.]
MRGHEYEANPVNKRGVVVERDPKKQRVRVRFDDEDDVTSQWIDVLSRSGGKTKTYMMPDEGDEVWCGMDAKGEAGCVLGVKYNDQNTPPHDSNDDVGIVWPGGSVHVNKATGAVQIQTGGTVKITAGRIELESDALTHNGTDISDKHKHKDVTPGPSETGEPVG